MKYFIVTGTSQGLGREIANQLIDPNHYQFCISRSKPASIPQTIKQVKHIAYDLSNIVDLEKLVLQMIAQVDRQNAEGIYLINNAATSEPIKLMDKCTYEEISNHLTTNLISQVVLTSFFIKHTKDLNIEKRVLNVSSQSAVSPIPGMSLYTISKAGIDAFTKSIGAEQTNTPHPVKVFSVWPGLIDTPMHEKARQMDKADFPDVGLFLRLKQNNLLSTPSEVAKKMIPLLFSDAIQNGQIIQQL